MSHFKDRQTLFSELASVRDRDIITLVTSTKKPEPVFAAQIAVDILPVFYELLKGKERKQKVDLFLYSAGGQIDAPWPLINLIREYYEDIYAIIPWRGHSAATLIALGGNTIGMGPLASLSPIDPQIQIRQPDKKDVVQASLEDIYGYYNLIKNVLQLDGPGRAESLSTLAGRIPPEILGKIERSRREIRIISINLLSLHLNEPERINNIVNQLVEELPSHQYMINRNEAARIGLPVEPLDSKTEEIASNILKSYMDEMTMDEVGVVINFDPGKTTKVIEMRRAFIETIDRSFSFVTRYTFHQDQRIEQAINRWMEVTT